MEVVEDKMSNLAISQAVQIPDSPRVPSVGISSSFGNESESSGGSLLRIFCSEGSRYNHSGFFASNILLFSFRIIYLL